MAKKKAAELPPLRETLVSPDAEKPESTTLEIDELWSFVDNKGNKTWIWIALCRKTRQVVARAVGDRSEKPVLSYGTLFQKNIVKESALPIFGKHISWLSRKIN